MLTFAPGQITVLVEILNMDIAITVGAILITGLFNGLVMFGVVKTEMKYLRRDIDNLHAKLSKHIEVTHG